MNSDPTTPQGPAINIVKILSSERFQDLDFREKYFLCTQHDHKAYDFSGRMLPSGNRRRPSMLLANTSEGSSMYVPLMKRRPSSPYRLGKAIVNRFTSMIFGSHRFPSLRVHGDSDTQDYCDALVEATALPAKMIEARNIGGSVGTVGLSWVFRNGTPIVNVHNGKYLNVSKWEDRDKLIPASVSEVYKYPQTEINPKTRQYETVYYWYRRDWTKTSDIGYQPVRVVENVDPVWEVDETTTATHDDGFCHFVWIRNLPMENEEDGIPDYEGQYESLDSLDMLLSVLTNGTTLNLDPTLVLNMEPEIVNRFGVKKGSDNALLVGLSGNARYLELGGQSVEAGVTLFNLKRKLCLEEAECVLTDPDKISSGQTSSTAIEKIYEPMLAKCDVFRAQYGEGIIRLLTQMLISARRHLNEVTEVVTSDGDNELVDINGVTQVIVPYLDLPLKVVQEDVLDEDGKPTGEVTLQISERKPGKGGDIKLHWGRYFSPTPEEQNSLIQGLSQATGGQAILSPQTASELLAIAFGRHPSEEWRRLTEHKNMMDAQAAAQMAAGGAFDGDPGGKVDSKDSLPAGADDTSRLVKSE